MTVQLSRQQQFDQALMQTCQGIARCVRIAMPGLGEQRRELLSEESLLAAYTVGRHFAKSMRIPMQDNSDLLLRCTPFSPEIHCNHLGPLHVGVRVVNNAWTDDAGDEAMQLLLEAMAEAGVKPRPPQNCMTPDQDPLRGDPSQSDVPACAQRLGPQGTSGGVPGDIGTPSDARGVHGDDHMEEGDMKEDPGPSGIHGDAQQCITPPPPRKKNPQPVTRIPPKVIQDSPTSRLVPCDLDPKVQLVVSLVTYVHPVTQVVCMGMITWRKET